MIDRTSFIAIWLGCVLVVILLVIVAFNWQWATPTVTKEKLSRAIESELQPGDGKEKVEGFLHKYSIEYRYDEPGGCFSGILRDVHRTLFTSESLNIKIFIGPNGYVSYEIRSVFTGP